MAERHQPWGLGYCSTGHAQQDLVLAGGGDCFSWFSHSRQPETRVIMWRQHQHVSERRGSGPGPCGLQKRFCLGRTIAKWIKAAF